MAATPRQQVLKLARRERILRAKDLDAIGVPRVYLTRLTAEGVLERRGRGLYALASRDASEQETLLEAVKLVPDGVVCLLSALRLHGLTTQHSHEVWLALPKGHWRPTRRYPPIKVVCMSGAALEQGVQERKVDGVTVRVFSPAKTVVDCFRFRNKIGLDVAIEALREARRAKAASMDEITLLARQLRLERIMQPYMESLT